MADIVDDASKYNALYQDVAFRNAGFDFSKPVSPALVPEQHPDFDGEHCVDCGVAIHPARLEAGRVRCVDCQTVLEQRSKGIKRA